MNGFLKIKNAIELKKSYEVPAIIFDQDFIAQSFNIKYKQYITNGNVMARCQYNHIKKYNMDYAIIHGDDWMEVEELGVKTCLTDVEAPAPIHYPIKTFESIKNISIPDYSRKGRFQVRIEAIKMLKEEFDDQIAIIGHVNAPYTMASMLIGLEDIMFLIHDNPDFLIKIIEIGFNNAIGCAKAQIEAGANMIWIGDTMASSWVISLEQFKKWALPYQKKLIDYIHNYDVYTFIQMHEKETDRIELMLQTDSDIINVANKADLKEAVNAIKGKKCLFGNIDPESVLFQGTPLKIKEKIDECISIAARGGGYIIGCCDNLPRYTPEENYKFFFDYVKSINLIL